jgi:hypothetical protein
MKSKKLLVGIVIACAFVLTLGLFGCGGSSDGGNGAAAPDAPGTPTTIQYASFNMPDGWAEDNESDSYVTIASKDNDQQIMKIFCEKLFEGDTVEGEAVERASYYNSKPSDPIVIGETTWIPVDFEFNDNASRYYFAPVNDEYYMYVTAYEITDADEPVQTVLSTLSVAVPEE